jgi:hypothetical protein
VDRPQYGGGLSRHELCPDVCTNSARYGQVYDSSYSLAENERMDEYSETRPEPPEADEIAGEFITETFDYDDGRQVIIRSARSARGDRVRR